MKSYDAFKALMDKELRPVVLLEGTREVPSEDVVKLMALARRLAIAYPHAVFRSGNARGSDEAFATGIRSVDSARLELVLPVSGHGKKQVSGDYPTRSVGLDQVSRAAEGDAATLTSKASPLYESLIEKRDKVPRLRAKANYLIRDTAKVTGLPEAEFAKADYGIFYVNPADPMKGGTGHTVRVCRELGVPVAFQDEWMHWKIAI